MALFIVAGCASTGARQAEVERITPEQLAKLMPPAVASLSLDEIVNDTKQGKSADEIIAKIKASNSRYELATAQVLDLSKQGVDIKVLDYMQQSNELAKQNAMADEINKREKEKRLAQERLQQERNRMRDRYDDPFYGFSYPYGFGYPYGAFGYPYGSHFGWGLGIGAGRHWRR